MMGAVSELFIVLGSYSKSKGECDEDSRNGVTQERMALLLVSRHCEQKKRKLKP